MDLDEYVRIFKKGKGTLKRISNLCGRVLKGKGDNDFKSLSHNEYRKVADGKHLN